MPPKALTHDVIGINTEDAVCATLTEYREI